MSEINTQKLEYTGATTPANTSKVSEAAFSGAHAGAAARAPAVVIVDANLDDAVGTPATAAVQPTGGAGLLGWLSGIYTRAGEIVAALGAALNIRALNSATDSVSIGGQVAVSNFPASQSVSAEALPLPTGASTAALQTAGNTALVAISGKLPDIGQKAAAASLPVVLASDQPPLTVISKTDEGKSYFTGVAIIPTTLTTGLNYFWIRNPDATKKIKIEKLEIILAFAGTAAATRSLYALKKFTGATATVGTVTLTPVAGQTGNPASIADVRWAAAGGTLTNATVGATLLEFGHANQLTTNTAYDRDMTDAPIVLGQNEGLVVQSDGAIVAGTTVILSMRWIEE